MCVLLDLASLTYEAVSAAAYLVKQIANRFKRGESKDLAELLKPQQSLPAEKKYDFAEDEKKL